MAASRGPVIRLHGPGDEHDRWVYFEEDFLDCILAAQRMGRTVDHPAGWPLSYQRPASASDHTWVWRPGENCHPNPIS